ncbi:MAG: phosphatidylserine/phosphatidylglycerophosphate/cardiolipin synthase family protein, partial [Caldilinea sp.]|nr:phosphatidylserine/phosphatidylglycerophosphate/cardiolipin synthase family protein [Caldilinea sp.]
MMEFAETYATPIDGQLGTPFGKRNDFKELFYLRWGKIRFDVRWGSELNIKVLLKVYRSDGIVEHFIVDTDPSRETWKSHRRATRDFFIHPFPANCGRVTCVKFAYIVHLNERSIPSQLEYIFFDGPEFDNDQYQRRRITDAHATPNAWRTYESDAEQLQRDVDW